MPMRIWTNPQAWDRLEVAGHREHVLGKIIRSNFWNGIDLPLPNASFGQTLYAELTKSKQLTSHMHLIILYPAAEAYYFLKPIFRSASPLLYSSSSSSYFISISGPGWNLWHQDYPLEINKHTFVTFVRCRCPRSSQPTAPNIRLFMSPFSPRHATNQLTLSTRSWFYTSPFANVLFIFTCFQLF